MKQKLIAGNWKMNGLKSALGEFESMIAGAGALAEKADLHVNSISFIERGMVPPALDTICALADALGVTVTSLVAAMEHVQGRN